MKKSFFLASVLYLSVSQLCAMQVKIETSDNQTITVDKSVLEKLGTIKDMLEDMQPTGTGPIQVPLLEEFAGLKALFEYLQKDPTQWQEVVKKQHQTKIVSAVVLAEKYEAPKELRTFLTDQLVNVDNVPALEFLLQNQNQIGSDAQAAILKQLAPKLGFFFSFDIADKEKQVLDNHSKSVTSVAFSPDGNYLASGSDDETVWVYSIDKQNKMITPFKQLKNDSGRVTSVAFSPDSSYLAAGSEDKTVWVYSIDKQNKTITPLQQLTNHTDWVDSVVFSPDGTYLVSGSRDNTVWVYKIDKTTKKLTPFQQLTGHANRVKSVAYSPDGSYLASGSYDKTVQVYAIDKVTKKLTLFKTLKDHSVPVNSVAFSSDGSYLASGSIVIPDISGEIIVYTVDKEQNKITKIQSLQSYDRGGIESVVFSPYGTYLVSGSSYGGISIFGIEKTKATKIRDFIIAPGTGVESLAFSRDGNYLAVASSVPKVFVYTVQSKITSGLTLFQMLLFDFLRKNHGKKVVLPNLMRKEVDQINNVLNKLQINVDNFFGSISYQSEIEKPVIQKPVIKPEPVKPVVKPAKQPAPEPHAKSADIKTLSQELNMLQGQLQSLQGGLLKVK